MCPLGCYHLWIAPKVGKVGNNFEAANSLRRMPRAQKLRCCHASSPSTPRRDPPVEQFGTVSLLLPHTGHGGGRQRKSSNTWTWCMMVEYRWEHLGTIKPSPRGILWRFLPMRPWLCWQQSSNGLPQQCTRAPKAQELTWATFQRTGCCPYEGCEMDLCFNSNSKTADGKHLPRKCGTMSGTHRRGTSIPIKHSLHGRWLWLILGPIFNLRPFFSPLERLLSLLPSRICPGSEEGEAFPWRPWHRTIWEMSGDVAHKLGIPQQEYLMLFILSWYIQLWI